MIFHKKHGTNIIEFNLYDDGEFLVSVTNDAELDVGHDFLFSKEEFEELKKYFDNTKQ